MLIDYLSKYFDAKAKEADWAGFAAICLLRSENLFHGLFTPAKYLIKTIDILPALSAQAAVID